MRLRSRALGSGGVRQILLASATVTAATAVPALLVSGFTGNLATQQVATACAGFTAIAWLVALLLNAVDRQAVTVRDQLDPAVASSSRLRSGLPGRWFLCLQILSVASGLAVFLATRIHGPVSLLLGLATIALGSAIAILRIWGFERVFGSAELSGRALSTSDSSTSGAAADEDPARVSVATVVTRLQKAQLVTLSVAALILMFVGRRTSVAVNGYTVGIVITTVLLCFVAGRKWRRILSFVVMLLAIATVVGLLSQMDLAALTANGLPLLTTQFLVLTCVACAAAAAIGPTNEPLVATAWIAGCAGVFVVAFYSALPERESIGLLAEVGWLLIPAAGLCFAHVGIALGESLRELSRAYQQLAGQAWATFRAAQADQAYQASLFETSRLLHDTLINTLGSVRLGNVDQGQFRSRLRDDLSRITSAQGAAESSPTDSDAGDAPAVTSSLTASPSAEGGSQLSERGRVTTVGALLDELTQRATLMKLSLAVVADQSVRDGKLSSQSYAAISGALLEALTNADKHSVEREVKLHAEATHAGIRIQLTNRSPGGVELRDLNRGVGKSIHERCRRAGLSVSVTAGNSEVTVSIEGPMEGDAGNPAGAQLVTSSNTRHQSPRAVTNGAAHSAPAPELISDDFLIGAQVHAARSLTFWPLGYCILLSAVWVGQIPLGWWLTGAVAATSATLLVIASFAQQRRIRFLGPNLITTCALVVVLQLAAPTQYLADGVLSPIGLSYVGAFLIVIATVFVHPSPLVSIAVAASYVAACLATAALYAAMDLAPAAPLVAALTATMTWLALQVSTRWLGDEAARARQAAAEYAQRTVSLVSHAANQSARRDTLRHTIDPHHVLLDGLLDGSIDPIDPIDRVRISAAEQSLRNVVAITSTPNNVSTQLLAALTEMSECGVAVEIGSFELPPGNEHPEIEVLVAAMKALANSPALPDQRSTAPKQNPASTLRLATFRDGRSTGFTLVVDRVVEQPPRLIPATAGDTPERGPDGQLLAEHISVWSTGERQTYVEIVVPNVSDQVAGVQLPE